MKALDYLLLGTCSLAAAFAVAADTERTSSGQDQKQVAVTIYNADLALIKDSREVGLSAGENRLAWRDVSAQMRPETALLRNLSYPSGMALLEQNFDFDLLTPTKLLEKYVGRKVQVISTNPATGVETTEEATVLSANEGAVLQFANRIESRPSGRLAFKAVPDNLRDRPTLGMTLNAQNGGTQNLELSYLSSGLSWNADYVAELSGNDDKLALNGWVTLTNQSGAAYRNAKLQLVAGDVNRVRDEMQRSVAEGRMLPAAAPKAEMSEESLFEYHLYSLERATTISENQTKQVALLSAAQVPVRKEYLLSGAAYYYGSSYGDLGQKLKVGVFVEFDNRSTAGLGVPLPKGVIRVYKKDAAGNAQFIGEDRIDHTPRNETVRLKLGEAFDVTAEKKQTDFKKLKGTLVESTVVESAFEIVLKNARKEAVIVTVTEPVPGTWSVLSESLPHAKGASNTAVWKVPVPAEGRTVLSYRVRSKF